MAKFKKGDRVELASGGPCMTVNDVFSGPSYECIWITPNGDKKIDEFDEELLVPCKI